MEYTEQNAIKIISKLAPWLAPAPSAYFVARSAMGHLALPLPVAGVVAAIIETLGLATVHTAIWLYDYNIGKRQSDPVAPVGVAVALGCVYLAATVGLTVMLEVYPTLATFAPALFPALAVVGAVNLALISQQEHREAAIAAERQERKAARQEAKAARQAELESASTLTAAPDQGVEAGPTPYKCAACERDFPTQQGLAAHIRHAHRNGHARPVEMAHSSAA